ncbi:branched-chain amino acid transporter permease [Streptomyces sp. TLI_171]|uniref:branched-chain amino acid transporter permease n=1 Tax=Streptomyces sp. TLI_171 TaxID=1938859 RepID=UPI000C5F70E9|nr:AzlD domain-containing protein [Streptomyces sp. TLI_171]RKE21547.1 branched-subunit amino acid transport protein AzlD [Streptomyces sp. TLI_171]
MPDWRYVLAGLLAMFAVTVLLRAAPFVLLGRFRESGLLRFLAATMPTGVMVILTVYTLRDLQLDTAGPAAAGLAATVGLHLWRRNALLSIVAGTAVYVLALQLT